MNVPYPLIIAIKTTNASCSASLNHPPYAGARPGGPGTENWVPPEIPTNPPRATFRTRSDSPAPVLITAPATAATQDPKFHTPAAQALSYCHPIVNSNYAADCDPGFERIRRSSTGAAHIASKEYSSAAANTSGSTTLSTPVMTPNMTTIGSGTYVFSNNFGRNIERATSRSFSGPMNSSHGTYSFSANLGPMSLASPFMPSTASVGVPNHMNPIVSSFAAAHGSSMTNLNGSYPISANSRGVNTNSPRLSNIPPMPAFTYGGSTHQAFQHLSSDLAGTSNTTQDSALNATKNGFQFEGGLAGLGINHGANFLPVHPSGFFADFSPSISSPAQMDATMTSGINFSGSRTDSSSNINASVQLSAEIIANSMRSSSPICSDGEATASPRLTQAGAGSKRKHNTIEVSFQPPKRANMASCTDQAGGLFDVLAASKLPSEADNSKEKSEMFVNVSSSQTTLSSSAVPTPAVTPDLAPCFSVGHPSTLPFTEQIQEQVCSTIEIVGTWHHGMHGDCSINARHCHGNTGSIFFLQTADYERAASSHHSNYYGPKTSGSPAIGPNASSVPAEIQNNAPVDLAPTSPCAGSDQVLGAEVRVGTPPQGTVRLPQRALSTPPHGAVDDHSDCIQRSAAAAASLEDYEYKLLYHVGASLGQSQANVDNDAQSSTLAPISEAPAIAGMSASLAPDTNLCTLVAEVADDFSSMANFEEDFDLDQSTIDVFSDSDECSSSLEASK